MSRICPQCGAENRDAAKFCLKCAHQLVPLGPAADADAAPRKRRRKRRKVAEAQPAHLRAVLVGTLALTLALGGLGLWIGRGGTRPDASVQAAPAPVAAAAAAPAPESAALAQVAEALQQLQTPPAAPREVPPESAPVPAPPAKAAARRPAAKPASAQAVVPAPEPVRVAEPAPAPPPPVAAPRPAPPRELCAGTQFVARGYCLQTECGQPGLQAHPQCVRMREQQDAMRRGSGEG